MTEEPEQTPTPDRGETTAQAPIEKKLENARKDGAIRSSRRPPAGRMPLFGR
jgi:hypothetical protein